MPPSPNISDFSMRLLAAFIFFTRLPFWRLHEVPAECFKRVVPYWPLVGWLTGGLLAGSLWLFSHLFPLPLAFLLAIIVRLLATGCLHEDGWADFCDGFGGGTTRERTLAIMKDSHIGTYGVIGLILYFLLFWQLHTLPLATLCALLFCGDCWSKFCAAQLINCLPYARKEEESKAKVVYNRMTFGEWLFALGTGLLPSLCFLPRQFWPAAVAPLVMFLLLSRWMKARLQGYTGDCCGATFVLCELSFYLTCLSIWNL